MDDKEKKAIKVFQNKKIKDVATKEKDSFFSVRYIPSNSILKQVESISNQKTNSILNSWVRLAADEKTYKRQKTHNFYMGIKLHFYKIKHQKYINFL